jgi:chemotaxis protein CheC
MTVPDVSHLDISDLGTVMGDEVATMVVFELQGDLPHGGFLLLHFSRESASKMAAILCGNTPCDSPMSELEKSALVEAGNIMVSSFLNASSQMLDLMMLPSPPYLVTDILHATVQSLVVSMGVDLDEILVFRIQLASPEYQIEGNIVLLIEESALEKMAGILESMVGNP